VLPLTWALVTEFSPTRLRSTSVEIIMVGYSLAVLAAAVPADTAPCRHVPAEPRHVRPHSAGPFPGPLL
jgi:hypothetical protein